MKNNRTVVALGRNAFGETFPEQQKDVKKAAEAIADLVEAEISGCHHTFSNGPQVGHDPDRHDRICPTGQPLHRGTDVPVWCHEPGLHRL